MNYGEPTAVKRRIPIYLVDGSRNPVAGLTLSGAEVQVSLSGAAFVNGGGTVTEVGNGTYYYQATQAETVTDSYLMLKVVDAAAKPFVCVVDIGTRISTTALAAQRHIPIYLVDTSGNPVSGLTLSGAEVQVSINGAAFGNALGAVAAIGSGAYDYTLDATEIAAEGFAVLKVVDAAAEPYIYAVDVYTGASAVGDGGYFGAYFGTTSSASAVVVPSPTPIPVPIVVGDPEYVGHVSAAINRLPQQFKSGTVF